MAHTRAGSMEVRRLRDEVRSWRGEAERLRQTLATASLAIEIAACWLSKEEFETIRQACEQRGELVREPCDPWVGGSSTQRRGRTWSGRGSGRRRRWSGGGRQRQ